VQLSLSTPPNDLGTRIQHQTPKILLVHNQERSCLSHGMSGSSHSRGGVHVANVSTARGEVGSIKRVTQSETSNDARQRRTRGDASKHGFRSRHGVWVAVEQQHQQANHSLLLVDSEGGGVESESYISTERRILRGKI
jgi:hypothetical protein